MLAAPADLIVFPSESGGLFEEIRERLPNGTKEKYNRWLEGFLDFSTVFSKSKAELAALNRKFAGYYMAARGGLCRRRRRTRGCRQRRLEGDRDVLRPGGRFDVRDYSTRMRWRASPGTRLLEPGAGKRENYDGDP